MLRAVLVRVGPLAVGPLLPAGDHGAGLVEAVGLALDGALLAHERAQGGRVEVVPLLPVQQPARVLRAVLVGVGPAVRPLAPAGHHRVRVVEGVGLGADLLLAAGRVAAVVGVEVVPLAADLLPAGVRRAVGPEVRPGAVGPPLPAGGEAAVVLVEVPAAVDEALARQGLIVFVVSIAARVGAVVRRVGSRVVCIVRGYELGVFGVGVGPVRLLADRGDCGLFRLLRVRCRVCAAVAGQGCFLQQGLGRLLRGAVRLREGNLL